jgi:hypothetical protein
MKLPLAYASGATLALVVDQKHLAALSSNEAHDVVPISLTAHHMSSYERDLRTIAECDPVHFEGQFPAVPKACALARPNTATCWSLARTMVVEVRESGLEMP